MSRTSRRCRNALAVVVVAALAVLAAAVPAHAASLEQTYKCLYPLMGDRALNVDIDADIPSQWERGVQTPPWDIRIDAEADLGTYQGLDLIGANRISGTATATVTVTAPGFTQRVKVPLTIPGVTKPPAPPLLLEGLSGQLPSLTFQQLGFATITVDGIDMNLTPQRADGSGIVLPPVVPVDSDGNPATFDVPCNLNPPSQGATLQTIEIVEHGDPVPLDPPGEPYIQSINDVTSTWIQLYWDASTSDTRVEGYEIRYEGKTVDVGNVTAYKLNFGCDGSAWAGEIAVRAYDAEGNYSAYSPSIFIELPQDGFEPPREVQGLVGTASSESTVDLAWDPDTGDTCIPLQGYEVFQDGVKVRETLGTSATITGLEPGTTYAFKVRAMGAPFGTEGPFSDEITVTTRSSSTVTYGYDVAGVSVLRTLTRGTVPITGSLDPELVLATGAFSGDLQLNRTRARLQVLGLIPVTADIAFTQTDRVRGTLSGGRLTAQARFKIRLPQLYLFGVLPMAPQDTCQTRSTTVAQLGSPDGFDAIRGGRLTGSYAISDLTGCGLLEPFLSPLTKGGGNTLDLTLTPEAEAL